MFLSYREKHSIVYKKGCEKPSSKNTCTVLCIRIRENGNRVKENIVNLLVSLDYNNKKTIGLVLLSCKRDEKLVIEEDWGK